jgi:hypothetical protein
MQLGSVDRVVPDLWKCELDGASVSPQAEIGPRPFVTLEDVAEVRAPRASLAGNLLQAIEFRHAPGYAQIGRALRAVAARVNQGEVVFLIRPVRGQRDDVVNLELALMENRVDDRVTDKAPPRLTVEQATLEGCSFLFAQTSKKRGVNGHSGPPVILGSALQSRRFERRECALLATRNLPPERLLHQIFVVGRGAEPLSTDRLLEVKRLGCVVRCPQRTHLR